MRRGFSFIEVLFAVMILGVGFIMIAAMFPVAIQQTQLTVDETSAARVGQNARNFVKTWPTLTTTWPQTTNIASVRPTATVNRQAGTVVGMRSAAVEPSTTYLNLIRGNQIDSADSRYAWVPMYQRDQVWDTITLLPIDSKTVRFYFFVAAVRNRTQYSTGNDVMRYPTDASANLATLEPVAVPNVGFYPDNTVLIPGTTPIGEGAYVIISDDPANPNANGQILRVSSSFVLDGITLWQLEPGRDISSLSATVTPSPSTITASPTPRTADNPVTVMLLGRGVADPTNPVTSPYEGAVQDISVVTTSITLP